jgi:hypothetical protein
MKIRLAVIPADGLAHIRHLIEVLQNAVNAGNIDGMDSATEELLSLTAGWPLIEISEEDWREFLAGTRAVNPAFQSDYLVYGGACSRFFSNMPPEAMVLQLPFDEKGEGHV